MAIIPTFHFLKDDEQLYIEGFTTRRVVNGPGQVVIAPLYRVKKRKAHTLTPTEYLRVRNILTGEIRNEVGPKLFFPSATDEILEKCQVITLKNNQYLRLIDKRTGVIRVEVGEQAIALSPYEEILGSIREGINIDEHNAVLVRDTDTGQISLITEPQVFFPAATQEVIEVRGRILLEDHETVVIKDKDGRYIFRHGRNDERSFFLEPYSEVVKFYWSSGLTKDKRGLILTHIDSRPKYMWYDFDVRTQDNVELTIGITFFWQIVDVERMIRTTDDTTGDVCAHARSKIIQAVSRTTLEQFLAQFNEIIAGAIFQEGDPFYAERGVRLLSVEVRYIQCKDPNTQRILQEIIQETTNRLNRLQKQESENEVRIRQVEGEIASEQERARLLEIQRNNARIEAVTDGEAEAQRVFAFIEGLGQSVSTQDKIALFQLLRKGDILGALSKGTAQLYFTPSDVDLSIDTHLTPQNGRAK